MIPDGTGLSFYQPLSSALPYGSQPITISGGTAVPNVAEGIVEGPPMVVSGSSCPLCGRNDYHVHSDSMVVNSTNNVVSGTAATAAVSSTPGLSTLQARCEHQ